VRKARQPEAKGRLKPHRLMRRGRRGVRRNKRISRMSVRWRRWNCGSTGAAFVDDRIQCHAAAETCQIDCEERYRRWYRSRRGRGRTLKDRATAVRCRTGHKRAIVALGRKLAVMVHGLRISGGVFEERDAWW
jgi:hypothetical protein